MTFRIVIFTVVLGLAVLSGRLYGDYRVQRDRSEQAAKASAEVVQRSQKALKADAQVQVKKRATLDSVRPALQKVRAPNASALSCPDAGFDRLLGDAVQAGNAAIESAHSMP